ncbi:MAG: F0F1 ATP synthase subunit beta, partial [Oscillospiraceae bacterium]|nr:F0F1 ATP synthase subunit beta [Oscillospiraceae bacterium]
MNKGTVIQISGSVIDVRFAVGTLPRIKETLTVEVGGRTLVMEVAQHIGSDCVRCILLSGSEGLSRGMEVTATGDCIRVPVGKCTLGRLFNVLGEPIDGEGPIPETEQRWSIHRKAPPFDEQRPAVEIMETGIKVIDLLEPYP